MLLVAIDVELLRTASGLVGHRLVGQVDLYFGLRILFDAVEELSQKVLADDDGQHEVVELVVLVDISKERADNDTKAVACNSPGSMLTRGARAEILACHEDATAVGGVVEDEILVHSAVGIVAPVAKQVVAKELLLAGGCLEEASRDNLVGIDVLQRKGNAGGCYNVEFLFHNSVRGSVITPVTAAAAATSGEQRMVRLPGP